MILVHIKKTIFFFFNGLFLLKSFIFLLVCPLIQQANVFFFP